MRKLLAEIPYTRWYRADKLCVYPELTNNCNFRCIYCPHSVWRKASEDRNKFSREKGFMPDELWNLVLENATKYARYVSLGFFGEPLLHPDFQKYVELVPLSRPYEFIIFTNFSLVTRELMETLKRFDFIIISLDASYSALWEKLCPGGPVLDLNGVPSLNRYATLVEKIEFWLNLEGHSRTQLCCVISSINEHDIGELISKWRPKLGRCDEIMTKTIISYGGLMKDKYMSKSRCDIPSNRCFQVAWNGDCTPCNLDVNIEWNVGNLLDARDMKVIREGEQWREVVQRIRRREGICTNCQDANNRSKDKFYYKEQLHDR